MKKIILILLLILTMTVISCTRDHVPPTPSVEFKTWKSHKTTPVILDINVWTDIEWEEVVAVESLNGINFLNNDTPQEDKSIIVIQDSDEIYEVKGFINTVWNGPVGSSVGIAIRVVSSTNNGTTWEESHYIQYYDYNDKGTESEGTHIYSGTLVVTEPTWVKLQVQVSNSNLILQPHPIFDKSSTATIYMANI